FAATDILQSWRLAATAIECIATAGREGAAGNRLLERRYEAGDLLQPLRACAGPSARDGGKQPAGIWMCRSVEQLQDRSLLHFAARVHDNNALAGLSHYP